MAQKKYEDYAQELYKLFPHIEEKSIDDIANFGLKKIYHYAKTGGDIFLRVLSFYLFIGNYKKEGENQWISSTHREHIKRRKLFKEKKIAWNRKHYFGLTEEENSEFLKNKTLPIISLYKLMKECAIRKDIRYIYQTDLGYTQIDKKVLWSEKRENFSIDDCIPSKEGTILLEKRKNNRELKLKTL